MATSSEMLLLDTAEEDEEAGCVIAPSATLLNRNSTSWKSWKSEESWKSWKGRKAWKRLGKLKKLGRWGKLEIWERCKS